MPDPILQNVHNAVRNPNGYLMVEKILEAVAVECERIGSKPFNEMGGHFIWKAIAREILNCVNRIKNQEYDEFLIRESDELTDHPQIIGITPR